jgi:Carboxypeptidase regulatory-like domain
MRLCRLLLIAALAGTSACHPGPVVGTTPEMKDVGGTLAGIVSTESNTPVVARKVTAIDTRTGARFEATTGPNGGYTMKVPQGHYRLEVEIREGERVTKQPPETRIQKSDLDPQRNFVITGTKS